MSFLASLASPARVSRAPPPPPGAPLAVLARFPTNNQDPSINMISTLCNIDNGKKSRDTIIEIYLSYQ